MSFLAGIWSRVKKRWKTLIALGIMVLPVLCVAGYVLFYVNFNRTNLPDIKTLVNFEPLTVGTVYDQNGKTIINLAREFRWISGREDIPEKLRQAFLSAEDKRFYEHNGVDWKALPRAGTKNFVHWLANIYHGHRPIFEFQQGASTLDQQLVRLVYLQDIIQKEGPGPLSKLNRKIENWRLAVWVNEELKKPEYFGSKQKAKGHILACLASYAYFRNVYGVKAASLLYFNKEVKDLDYAETALLAGIMKNPRVYAPPTDMPQKTNSLAYQKQLNRRNDILDLMVKNGYLHQEMADRLKETVLPIPSRKNIRVQTDAPSVVGDMFKEVRKYNLDSDKIFDGKLQIHTSVNIEIQKLANQALENGLASYEKRHPEATGFIQGSVVVLRNSDGAILTQVGGRQLYNGQPYKYSDLNRVTYSKRQPGSAFKPFVYVADFNNGGTLEDMVSDQPIAVDMGWEKVDGQWTKLPPKFIENYDGQFKGAISKRQALAESRNIPAIRVAMKNSIDKISYYAEVLGIKTPLQPYITTALGASEVNLLELANAYRAIASGLNAEPYMIEKILDQSGKTLFLNQVKYGMILENEITPLALQLIVEGLRGVVRIPGGTAHSLDNKDFPVPVMGKTGTTNDFKDAWFLGSTYGPDGITIGVKVGFDEPSRGYDADGNFGVGPERGLGDKESGGRVALPIFRELMLGIYNNKLAGPPPQFPEEIEKNIDRYLAPPEKVTPEDTIPEKIN